MKTLPQQVKELYHSTAFLGIAMLTLAASLFCINGKVDDLNCKLNSMYSESLDTNVHVAQEMMSRSKEISNITDRVATLEDHLGLTYVEDSSEEIAAHYVKTKDVQGKVNRFLTDSVDLPRCILGTNCSSY